MIGRPTIGERSRDPIRAANGDIAVSQANGRGGRLVRTTGPGRLMVIARRARMTDRLVLHAAISPRVPTTNHQVRHAEIGRRARTTDRLVRRVAIARPAHDRRIRRTDTRIGTATRIGTGIPNETATRSAARRTAAIATGIGVRSTIDRRDLARRHCRRPTLSSRARS